MSVVFLQSDVAGVIQALGDVGIGALLVIVIAAALYLFLTGKLKNPQPQSSNEIRSLLTAHEAIMRELVGGLKMALDENRRMNERTLDENRRMSERSATVLDGINNKLEKGYCYMRPDHSPIIKR